jgi:hypothetical protein
MWDKTPAFARNDWGNPEKRQLIWTPRYLNRNLLLLLLLLLFRRRDNVVFVATGY